VEQIGSTKGQRIEQAVFDPSGEMSCPTRACVYPQSSVLLHNINIKGGDTCGALVVGSLAESMFRRSRGYRRLEKCVI